MIKFNDYLALYGATLSTIIAIVGAVNYIIHQHKKISERKKFKTGLYYLTKIDRITKEKMPIIVILLANLGTERISIKSIEYSGISNNGCKTSGTPGWYEQPEEAFGIRNRLLPVILESGDTIDLPMLSVGIFTDVNNLRIKLTDFNNNDYFIEQSDIDKIKKEIKKRNKTNGCNKKR